MSTQLPNSGNQQELGEKRVRTTAAFALAMNRNPSPEVYLKLVETLWDPTDFNAVIDAARILGTLEEHSDKAVEELSAYLEGGLSIQARIACARALGSLGEKAISAADLLAKMLNDGNEGLQETVAEVIGSLKEHASPAIPRICESLRKGN